MKVVFKIATDQLVAGVIASPCAIAIMVVAVMTGNTTIAMAAIATITAIGYSTVAFIKHRYFFSSSDAEREKMIEEQQSSHKTPPHPNIRE